MLPKFAQHAAMLSQQCLKVGAAAAAFGAPPGAPIGGRADGDFRRLVEG